MPKIPEKRTSLRLKVLMGATVVATIFTTTAFATRGARHFLGTDARFILRHRLPGGPKDEGITLVGANFASLSSVQQIFATDFGRSIFDIPIAERRRRLLGIDWIADASVSRIWPNRIVVHVRERRPVAFVNVPHQGFLLVDGEGVLLSPPARANFEFPVLDGIWIDQSEPERRERVESALRMLDDLGPVAKDVSEINAASPDDLRITSEVQGKAVELWMGDANFGSRYRNFMEHFAEIHAGSPQANVFDLRIDDRITAR